MTMNGAVLPVLGLYQCRAEQGARARRDGRKTIQNDILERVMVR